MIPLLYRFLKAIADLYGIQGKYDEQVEFNSEVFEGQRNKIENGLKTVIDKAGLISV